MTKSEVLEEVDRIQDNLSRIEQEMLRLKKRLDKALKATQQPDERNTKS